MTLPTKLIVFDCDGTLADSHHLLVEAMYRAFLDAALLPPSRAAIMRTAGLPVPEAIAQLMADPCLETVSEVASSYRNWHIRLRSEPNIKEPMFKGALRALQSLSERTGVKLGIATGKSRRALTRFIESNALEPLFATLQSADDSPGKPHPAMLFQAMEETGAMPENTVMIGDTSYDMIMAACAGVKSIGVTWGHHTQSELANAGANKIAQSFDELFGFLQQGLPPIGLHPVMRHMDPRAERARA